MPNHKFEKEPGYGHLPSEKVKITDISDSRSLHNVRKGFVLPSPSKKHPPKPGFVKEDSLKKAEREVPITIPTQVGTKKINSVQLEAAMADFYRYLLGPDRVPKTHVFQKESGDRYLLISREIEGYTSFRDYYDWSTAPEKFTAQRLVQGGVASMQVANLVLEESDCHRGNFGFDKSGKVVRIDFDLSLGSISREKLGKPYNPANYTTLTQGDLENLFFPPTFHPYNSILHLHRDSTSEFIDSDTSLAMTLKEAEFSDEFFKLDKWRTLLKAAILSRENIEMIFSAHIKDKDIVEVLTDHLFARIQTIKQIIPQIEEFRSVFFRHHAKLAAQIENDIDEYNRSLSKKNFSKHIFIDPGDIELEYGTVATKIQKSQLLNNLQSLLKQYSLQENDPVSLKNMMLRTHHANIHQRKYHGFTPDENYLLEEAKNLITNTQSKEDLEELGAGLINYAEELKKFCYELELSFEKHKARLIRYQELSDALTDTSELSAEQQEERKKVNEKLQGAHKILMTLQNEYKRVMEFRNKLEEMGADAIIKSNEIKIEEPDYAIQERIQDLFIKLDEYIEKTRKGAAGLLKVLYAKVSGGYKKEQEQRLQLIEFLKHTLMSPPKTHEGLDKKIKAFTKAAQTDPQLAKLLEEAIQRKPKP